LPHHGYAGLRQDWSDNTPTRIRLGRAAEFIEFARLIRPDTKILDFWYEAPPPVGNWLAL
jgi:hypothetical protein